MSPRGDSSLERDRGPAHARLLEWFVPDGLDDRVERLRAQLYVVLSGLVAANAALFAGLHLVHHAPGAGLTVVWIIAGLGKTMLVLPFLLKLGGPMPVLSVLFTAALEVGVIAIACFDGGLASGAVFWMVVAPLAAAFLGGARLGWTAAAVSVGAGLAMYGATLLGYAFPSGLLAPDAALHYAINFASCVVFVAALSALYEGPMVLHFRDLSDQLQTTNDDLRRELARRRQAQTRAEAAAQAKDVLLANMSHEFRTPLTSILGFTEILASDASPDDRPLLESIDRGGRRLLNTLNGVLDLVWIESGEGAPELEPVDAQALVGEVASAFVPTAVQRGLSFRVSGDDVTVLADPESLRRVVEAVVDNAVRFTERGAIEVSVEAGPEAATIGVADTGIGMGAEFLDKAAQPFRQASEGEARTHEGVGVGLTVARCLTERMGGSIQMESALGRGTTVRIVLPVVAANATAAELQTDPIRADRG